MVSIVVEEVLKLGRASLHSARRALSRFVGDCSVLCFGVAVLACQSSTRKEPVATSAPSAARPSPPAAATSASAPRPAHSAVAVSAEEPEDASLGRFVARLEIIPTDDDD